jgi:hypothetical protein
MGEKLCQLTIVNLRAFDKNILLIKTDNSNDKIQLNRRNTCMTNKGHLIVD